jgi:hypothetical protein
MNIPQQQSTFSFNNNNNNIPSYPTYNPTLFDVKKDVVRFRLADKETWRDQNSRGGCSRFDTVQIQEVTIYFL